MKPTAPVDLYIRISRVGGRENMISESEQERRSRALAAEKGLTVGVVLTDLDESGGKWERPGLQEGLERVRSGVSGGLIVAWLDRLSRDSEHSHRIVREIGEAGGAIYAPDAPADWTSPEGELQAGIVFAFAQYVRKRARAGFERSKEQAIARGIPVNSRAAVGYRKNDDRRLVLDPSAAPVVREVFERRAAGAGPAELGALLESRGVKTSMGASTWSQSSVMQLLRSRVYLGELAYGKDRRFLNVGSHEAIVDLATWTAAQHPNGRALRGPREEGRFMLSGLLRCQGCGYAMQPTDRGTARGKTRRYKCRRRHAGGLCPNPVGSAARFVEDAAERLFWLSMEGAGDAGATGAVSSTVDLGVLAAALELAGRRLEQALTPEMQDAAGAAWPAMVAGRRRERDEAAAALGNARAEASKRSIVPSAPALREMWPSLSLVEKREFLGANFDAVVLRRTSEGVDLFAFPLGAAPDHIYRRGHGRGGVLRSIDMPVDAWVTPLEYPYVRGVDAL